MGKGDRSAAEQLLAEVSTAAPLARDRLATYEAPLPVRVIARLAARLGRLLGRGRKGHNRPLPAGQPERVWCLVGNIVGQHKYGQVGEIRRGSRQFTAGTKVYCLPPQWGDNHDKCVAVGIARKSRRWITVVMPTDLIENWRAELVYHPQAWRRLAIGFDRFKRLWESREEIELIVRQLDLQRRPGRRVAENDKRST